MLVSQYLIRGIPELRPDSLISEIYTEDYPDGIEYAPVLEDGKFLGFLDLADLEFDRETHSQVGQCDLETVSVQVKDSQHLFEILPLFAKTGLSLLPAQNPDGETEGYISQESVIKAIGEAFSHQAEGGIIVLTVPAIQYSLSEISRLVEANQGKVLSVMLDSDPVLNQNYLVHLKINQLDLSRIVATLERFEYHVLVVHQTVEATSVDKERFDQLMRYLGI